MLSKLINLEFACDKDYSFTQRKPTLIAITSLVVMLFITGIVWFILFAIPTLKYDQAIRVMYNDSTRAQNLIEDLNDNYRDMSQLRPYINALKLSDDGIFEKSITEFNKFGDYRETQTQLAQTKYAYAEKLAHDGAFDEAYDMFMNSQYYDYETRAKEALFTAAMLSSNTKTSAEYLSRILGYRNADELYKTNMYSYAQELISVGDNLSAANELAKLNAIAVYKDSLSLEHQLWYELALAAADNNDYSSAKSYIVRAVDYPSVDTVTQLTAEYNNYYTYNSAVRLMEQEEYVEAIALFDTIEGFLDADDLNSECEKIAYAWEFDGFLSTDGTEATKADEFYSNDKIYIVGTLSGGKPEKNVDLVFTWTDCKKRKSTCVVEDWTNNTNGGCYFSYSHPKNADTGKSTITIMVDDTDEIIATFTFKVSVAK